MSKIAILREKVTKLVAMLTEKKVKVTQRGATAKVEYDGSGKPKLVNLPYIPEDADDDYLRAVEGFLDQQVSRVLYSDYQYKQKSSSSGVEGLFSMINDAFVERKMAEVFRGSGSNLNAVSEFYIKNVAEPSLRKDPMNPKKHLLAPAIRALSGQEAFVDFMDDKWEYIEDVMDKVGDYLRRELPKITSSEDAFRVAVETKRLMEEEDGEGGEGEDKNDSGKSDSPNDNSERDEGEGEQNSQGQKSAQGEQKGEEGEEDPEHEPNAEEDDGDGDGSEDEDEGAGQENPKNGEVPESSKEKPSSVTASDFDSATNMDDAIETELTKRATKEIKESDYKVWSTDFDFIGPLSPKEINGSFKDSMVREMENEVDFMVGPMQKDIERIIAARSRAHWTPGHRSGHLNPSALARMANFGDERVFRRRHVGETRDTAISLVVDCSGSMGMEGKIRVASRAAYGLSLVLERIKIPHEIIGFTTDGLLPEEAQREAIKLGIEWSRLNKLYIPVFKSFNQRLATEERKRMAALAGASFMESNIDGECVAVAAARLAQRKEKRKIMIVLSDGMPAGYANDEEIEYHLQKTIKDLPKQGIEVFGIGIKSKDVARFYPKYCVINEVDQLPTIVIGKMREMLFAS
ncbi:hypothetical protein [Methyloversatilis sp.]|uniref:cobaltochelatase CobT-related protein n=1 Tax=Methyloversatilis sp. TaxID=2569862 RepID=UPI0035AEBBEC